MKINKLTVVKFFSVIALSCMTLNPVFAYSAIQSDDTVKTSNAQIIAQLNYCINSLTNIIENGSMPVYEYELDQLLNNLRIEEIVHIPEITNFRTDLMNTLSNLKITEEERNLLRRIQAMKRDNLFYHSLSKGLNGVMLLVPGSGGGSTAMVSGGMAVASGGTAMAIQAAFNVLLTSARTAVEYKATKEEQSIEELQEMWNLRKNDMEQIRELRTAALDLTIQLYKRFHLKEEDRLTEKTAKELIQIVKEEDSKAKIRKLLDVKDRFGEMLDFQYFLGMAYVGTNQYEESKPYLDRYLRDYKKSPIFRHDAKTGCIAMVKLTNEKNLSPTEQETLIQDIRRNLTNNGTALLQCVLQYLTLNRYTEGFDLLRKGIESNDMTDKDALVFAVINLLPEIKKYPKIESEIYDAVTKCKDIDVNLYLSYIVNNNKADMWEVIMKSIEFKNIISDKGFFAEYPEFNDEFSFSFKLPHRIYTDKISVYKEFTDKNKTTITKNNLTRYGELTKEEILGGVKAFKNNPDLFRLFFTPVIEGKTYCIKKLSDNDYTNIQNHNYYGMRNYNLSENDKGAIIKYCKKQKYSLDLVSKPPYWKTDIRRWLNLNKICDMQYWDIAFPDSVDSITECDVDTIHQYLVQVKDNFPDANNYLSVELLGGDTLSYNVTPFFTQDQNYIRIVLDSHIRTVLTFVARKVEGTYQKGGNRKEWDDNYYQDLMLYSVESQGKIRFFQPQVISRKGYN